MILGFDHLSLSVTNTAEVSTELVRNGYACAFSQSRVPNHPAKRSLLAHYTDFHDLALFRPKQSGVAIEITNHGPSFAKGSSGPYRIQNDAVVLRTSTPNQDSLFLRHGMNFSQTDEGFFQLDSLVPSWRCSLRLFEDPESRQCLLDSPGHTCLALLCRSVNNLLPMLESLGATDITESFALTVNGKNIRIAMVRSPSGALFELIEITS